MNTADDWHVRTPYGTEGPFSTKEIADKLAKAELPPTASIRSGDREWNSPGSFGFGTSP
jgi:hypothetical protein